MSHICSTEGDVKFGLFGATMFKAIAGRRVLFMDGGQLSRGADGLPRLSDGVVVSMLLPGGGGLADMATEVHEAANSEGEVVLVLGESGPVVPAVQGRPGINLDAMDLPPTPPTPPMRG